MKHEPFVIRDRGDIGPCAWGAVDDGRADAIWADAETK